MFTLDTERLTLVRTTEDFLNHSFEGNVEASEEWLNATIPEDWFAKKEFIDLRRTQLRDDPTYREWSVWAIVLSESSQMIGHIGFHSPPDLAYLLKFVPTGIEFGYTIFPKYRRNGYATEAIQALMAWAIREQGIKNLIISISPDNTPSQALARHFGFKKIGEHQDEIDGLEEVFVLTADAREELDHE